MSYKQITILNLKFKEHLQHLSPMEDPVFWPATLCPEKKKHAKSRLREIIHNKVLYCGECVTFVLSSICLSLPRPGPITRTCSLSIQLPISWPAEALSLWKKIKSLSFIYQLTLIPFENQTVFIILTKSKSIPGKRRSGRKIIFKLFARF